MDVCCDGAGPPNLSILEHNVFHTGVIGVKRGDEKDPPYYRFPQWWLYQPLSIEDFDGLSF